MLAANNFTYGLITPVLAYLMSCMGAFIGLRCTTRAFAYSGGARLRWLGLAAVAIGTTGIWLMHFIAMLGYTIPGMTIHYDVPVTIGSLLIAVVVVFAGLLIIGFGRPSTPFLLLGGIIMGLGVVSMHYTGMAAIRMTGAGMTYTPVLFGASVAIGIVAATAALWAALRLRGLWSTLGASLIMGVAVSGMHYTGMAAMEMKHLAGHAAAATGPTAQSFVLPLIIGVGVVSIIMSAVLVFSPTDDEIREDQELMARISAATARLSATTPPAPPVPTARWGTGPRAANGSGPRSYVRSNGNPGARLPRRPGKSGDDGSVFGGRSG
ncbi:MAG TPA: MHYT domain-containing protein [Streptosporangiaceae bacterium]|nr:MHYT domain-containing protein [Streptosporangiaceae bacterium]